AKAWTFRAARKLAQAEAEKLAKEATNAKSLKDTFADRATESAMFSWLTQGFTPFGMGEPQFSEVKGVDTPGTAFMQRVFTLKVGETGVAPNNPETVYYVIRAIKFAPDEAVIRDMFVGSGPQRVFQAISPIASRERQQMERNWLSDLEKEYKVTWLRDARQLNDEM
ncbi:MAG TPA: hypothetical protein VL096_20800, partial [Pirellulaceae bacterium]|nr:hypothetical protein [Pirellulaceae bacterium]